MRPQIITTVLALLLAVPVFAQSTMRVSSNSEVKVEGTSNVHDWGAVVEEVRFEGTRTNDVLDGIRVRFVVESMESGDGLMNRRIYSTLNSDDHPEIVFNITDSSLQGERLTMNGTLTINGVRKQITVRGEMRRLNNGNIRIQGSHPVLFTDHGMDAPSFMFGAMKVGNTVQINYNIVLIP